MKKLIVVLFIVSFHLPLCACGEKTAGTVFPTVTQEAEAASEPSMISDVTDVMGTGEVISDIGSAAEVPDEPEASADTETEPQSETDADIPSGARPRKYFTICFDDGITQDLKIIEIFKKYGFTSCTFFINTGLYGANWKQVGRMHDRPDVTHIRFTKKELESGIYDGFDVAVHTLTHKALKAYDKNPKALRREVENDAENIYGITSVYPVGVAWPGGENDVTETTKKLVFENTSIRFARGAYSTHSFQLPTEFLMWQPTCSVRDPEILSYARSFIEAECTEDMLFFVWGHGYELDLDDSYGMLDELIRMITEADDIVCVTNTEFYQLFKDQIPSLK